MAEVLITLGIISAVAAMTLPTLINRIEEQQYKTAYKKAYSALSQAFLRMQAENEYLDTTATKDALGTSMSINIGENFKIISKYFKATKTCFDKNADVCFECETGQAGYIGNGEPDWLGCAKSNYAFVDASGMSWYLYSNSEYPLIVDVNGKKKPNQLGKDRFVLRFASNSDRNNYYMEEADSIVPWNDITEKMRWCPSGNCLYQTWLRK